MGGTRCHPTPLADAYAGEARGSIVTRVDFDSTVTPREAGLGRFVKLSKPDFVGRNALAARTAVERRLTGLRAAGDTAPPRGALVRNRRARVVGRVTSACMSPTLGGALALAYVEDGAAGGGLTIEGVHETARPVGLPF